MPAVTSGKVLVTGANGYIAVWVVKTFLDQGFSVRGTVRSENKAGHLRSLFKDFGDKFEVVVVEDITKDGAFDEAVKGVDAIAHTASPFHLKAVEPEELIVPAVNGTTGILASALKNAPSVKRIVVTSSCASVLTPSTEPRIFSEENWNDASIAEVKEKGKDATPLAKYRTSKTLAERAAWDFWNKHKSEVSWDLVVLNPPFVFGPFLHDVDKPENLNESAREFYDTVVKGTKDKTALVNLGSSYVDVRDLALAHALAITKQEASGNRIIVSAGAFKWQDFVSAAHKYYSSLPAGNTEYDPAKATHFLRYAPEKQQRLLGIKFKTVEETTKDTLDDFKARGWL
ncbi:NAD(P)-binding protein [Lentinus tigrinus ALCF2SS1-7]|uniref:NAD(P)-binding protein n=1 Tax=Lentinus tigrinus ALCF2SS1-6 TaxID=1328759 RepID=A0A5C2SQ97_9APHY|nr:NAD(P)-binding protein [Lentinus tigrinus ALCF2SS1-6]RPD79314.1 NAD(P)-binding protein [Lentinus tigrinus ALCF2SS1-7]